MNKKTLVVLGGFILIVAVIQMFERGDTRVADAEIGAPLLPGLAEALDTVEQVSVSSAEGSFTLAREDAGWGIVERCYYPVDFLDLTTLTTSLAEAKYVERKTARAENLPRMGLEDVTAIGSTSVLVELSGGEQSWSVLLGDRASARTGQYARFPPETQVWQINKYVAIDRNPVDWLEQTIINIESDRVIRVVVDHSDGERLELSKEDGTFALPDLAEGEELKYSSVASEPSRALVNMRLTDVISGAELDWAEPVVSQYYCADGLIVTVEAIESEGKHYVRLGAGLDDSVADVAAEVQAEAAEIEARSDRVFEVAQYTYKDVSKRRADLLKAPPAEDADVAGE